MKNMIRVGNAQAFWGDRPSAASELLAQIPDLDFLTMDYLAEVSMSILALQRERNPSLGYPQDFVEVVRGLVKYWAAGGRCRLIANAGGLNPLGCAVACQAALESEGCRSMKIGVVSGDDVLTILRQPNAEPALFQNLDSLAPLSSIAQRLVTANAYLGCEGIVRALEAGADIVITGRIADPSMVVAPCVYAFGWQANDWKRLAGATVAGHLLECGTHVTGGISTDWLSVPDAVHLGFPVAEIDASGDCVITKSEISGGRVTIETVKEQLIYEIGNPAQYLSPDVCVSFLSLEVEPVGRNRVSVRGAVGSPCPQTLKVSATYRDGYRAAGLLTLFGPHSVLKARRCGEIVLQRLREAGHDFRDAIIECLGNAESVPVSHLAACNNRLYETVLRIAVESDSKAAVESFSQELMPLVTAGPQGTTGYAEGRPRVHGVYRYWPCLIESKRVQPLVECIETQDTSQLSSQEPASPIALREGPTTASDTVLQPNVADKDPSDAQSRSVTCLADIAYGRSGDKGTGANIGILARTSDHYDWLKVWLTAQRVKDFFAPLGVDSVERFELPNLDGLNFVLRGILKRTVRNDAQGKALAQALLSMPIAGFPQFESSSD